MAKNTTQFFLANINNSTAAIVNADGTTKKDVISAGANDSLVRSLSLVTSDTAAAVVELYLYDGSNARLLYAVAVPALSGSDGSTAPIDLLGASLLPLRDGKRYLPLKTGQKLQVAVQSAVTAAKQVTVVALGEDF